jgi:hypothetical protein
MIMATSLPSLSIFLLSVQQVEALPVFSQTGGSVVDPDPQNRAFFIYSCLMLSPGGQILDDLGEVGVRGVSLGNVDPMGEVSHHLKIKATTSKAILTV